ncbi:hypothetical protein L208DRAFT_1403287 [Tricholoma matsutake]|nr:hypothetical protein L208DRAFT_1403287 [Tricholoma matsutake 945]
MQAWTCSGGGSSTGAVGVIVVLSLVLVPVVTILFQLWFPRPSRRSMFPPREQLLAAAVQGPMILAYLVKIPNDDSVIWTRFVRHAACIHRLVAWRQTWVSWLWER